MPKATIGKWASLLLDLPNSLCCGFTNPRLMRLHAHGCAADTCMRCGLSTVQAHMHTSRSWQQPAIRPTSAKGLTLRIGEARGKYQDRPEARQCVLQLTGTALRTGNKLLPDLLCVGITKTTHARSTDCLQTAYVAAGLKPFNMLLLVRPLM